MKISRPRNGMLQKTTQCLSLVVMFAFGTGIVTVAQQPPPTNAPPPILTGAFGFTCNASGNESDNEQWDTLSTGRIWNLWFSAGVPGGSPDGLSSPILNGPSNAQVAISFSLQPGTNDYTFFAAYNDHVLSDHGINLFFNGRTAPSISAKAATRTTNAPLPDFTANGAPSTYALNGSHTNGAGTLTLADEDWVVTLTQYFWAHPTVFQSDRVTRGITVALPDGTTDFVGQLSLIVTRPNPKLSIAIVATNVMVGWPSWASDFRLEATDRLPASPSWTTITNEPTVSGSRNSVMLPIDRQTRFYRLNKTL